VYYLRQWLGPILTHQTQFVLDMIYVSVSYTSPGYPCYPYLHAPSSKSGEKFELGEIEFSTFGFDESPQPSAWV
jgi:hypothetical protein